MRIGIIGAGQLGLMLGEAALDLGFECRFLDPSEDPPAARRGEVIRAAFDDPDALSRLATGTDLVTYEFENVPVDALERLQDKPVYPPPAALAKAQDRLAEKRLFEALSIPVPRYRAVDSAAELEAAAQAIGLPLVLKTRRFGYDGKGQAVVRLREEMPRAFESLGGTGLIAEERIRFDFEVSAIGARNAAGETLTYPLTHNEHAGGILRRSRAPVANDGLRRLADGYLAGLMKHLDYVGVLALELFVTGDALLANEFAPRVHNSGHWTIEGARTSQFTNHLLAIAGESPRDTHCPGHAGMLNLIGHIPDRARSLPFDCRLHDYGKAPRAGRKLGHITIVRETAAERDRVLAEIERSVTESTP